MLRAEEYVFLFIHEASADAEEVIRYSWVLRKVALGHEHSGTFWNHHFECFFENWVELWVILILFHAKLNRVNESWARGGLKLLDHNLEELDQILFENLRNNSYAMLHQASCLFWQSIDMAKFLQDGHNKWPQLSKNRGERAWCIRFSN